ncbi:MAG: hypothetical protein MUE85_00400 [Microscillaceae bacterium]|jgi:hypothetical protein|nr:hypothetical protein [Microscillaceae bacterium]
MIISEAFGEVANIIAQLNPSQIIQIKASPEMSARVSDLVDKKKSGVINLEETAELERFLALDLFISLAKAKAHLLLKK